MLNTALGGGLSSRLFQQIRESRGLAYTVYSAVEMLADSSALSVYAACQPDRFAEVARVTTEILDALARDGISEAECRTAKGSLRGGLVLGLEDSNSRMHRLGRSELNYGRHHSLTATLRHLEAVTVADVNALARRLLRQPYGAVVFGPHRSKRALPAALRAVAD